MPNAELFSWSGLGLLFVLGLRHGFDPDHIAVIDGLTLRAEQRRPGLAPWIGTLFSLGHGGLVTVIAVAVSLLSDRHLAPEALETFGTWVPIALLLLVGTFNLRALLAPGEFQPIGARSPLLPERLKHSSHPLAIVLVGVLFGLVFDTATQAAAWGYVATSSHGPVLALAMGLSFTSGMAVTDTIDSRLLSRVLRRAKRDEAARFRRILGWTIVAMSYGVAAYGIARWYSPAIELPEGVWLAAGITLVAAVGAAYVWLSRGSHPGT